MTTAASPSRPHPAAGGREIFAWAMYDFANSGYTTVVLTAVFSAYFVGVIAGDRPDSATLMWTLATGTANVLVILSAPVLGALADYSAAKKRFLAATTVGCVIFTAMLALPGPGDVWLTMALVVLSSLMFFTGENLVAAFLPELAPQQRMGRVSAYGWTVGYLGGLLVLGLCLAYINWAKAHGDTAEQFVPVTMLIVAVAFAVAAAPTFIWLRERAEAKPRPGGQTYVAVGFTRLRGTLAEARRFRDLFRFLVALTVYHCGINTVVVLAAVYAQEVMGFETEETILLILVVNLTAALGAFLFGRLQDRFGSLRVLAATLLVWILATVLAYYTEQRTTFWVVANLVGLSLGASQSVGRAMVGQFSPVERCAEFFGLWGLATKLAAVIGPISYGLITLITAGNHRLAILSTVAFFIAGLVLLIGIDEERGRKAAKREDGLKTTPHPSPLPSMGRGS